MNKLIPDFALELQLTQEGYGYIAGVDEAGRGAWAGPVVAAAVILPLASHLDGLCDSKRMSPEARARMFVQIQSVALGLAVGIVDAPEIDRCGILPATRRAMQLALSQLQPQPTYVLCDYVPFSVCELPCKTLVRGESSSLSIAAASVVAKVTRDRLMIDLDAEWPGYHFARHKGYGTPAHQQALRELGPCVLHRHSFAPVAQAALQGRWTFPQDGK